MSRRKEEFDISERIYLLVLTGCPMTVSLYHGSNGISHLGKEDSRAKTLDEDEDADGEEGAQQVEYNERNNGVDKESADPDRPCT